MWLDTSKSGLLIFQFSYVLNISATLASWQFFEVHVLLSCSVYAIVMPNECWVKTALRCCGLWLVLISVLIFFRTYLGWCKQLSSKQSKMRCWDGYLYPNQFPFKAHANANKIIHNYKILVTSVSCDCGLSCRVWTKPVLSVLIYSNLTSSNLYLSIYLSCDAASCEY